MKNILRGNAHIMLESGDSEEGLVVLANSLNDLLSRFPQSAEKTRRFVADASHELRTPISVIRGEADVALMKNRSPVEYRASLTTILDESRRLSRLVDDLLFLATPDTAHVGLKVEEFYLNDLVDECCRSLAPTAKARGVRLENHSRNDVGFCGDEALLRRLIVKLIENAISYTPAGGNVSLFLEAREEELRILVSDTGIGIGAKAKEHVFEPFYRADKARSRGDAGPGLGLSIVKRVAELHEGRVEVKSEPGNGSTFTVLLPHQNTTHQNTAARASPTP
jgi:signal transduction histidine kinase